MSAENPNQRLEQSPEQHSWQGQKWEYLIALAGIEFGYLYFIGEDKNPIAQRYNEEIEKIRKKEGRLPHATETLKTLGENGWETVVGVAQHGLLDQTYLVFKRPLPQKED